MFFPPKRILPIYGYLFEIRVECKGCQVDGSSATDMHFTAGIVEVAWRRLQKSNPRQGLSLIFADRLIYTERLVNK